MQWINLTTETQWFEIMEQSYTNPQVVLSTLKMQYKQRCKIKTRTQWEWSKYQVLLSRCNYPSRAFSIAADLQIIHESPQVLLIKGTCVYHEATVYYDG